MTAANNDSLVQAAALVVAGWRAGRIAVVDRGEDVPEGEIALTALADLLLALGKPRHDR